MDSESRSESVVTVDSKSRSVVQVSRHCEFYNYRSHRNQRQITKCSTLIKNILQNRSLPGPPGLLSDFFKASCPWNAVTTHCEVFHSLTDSSHLNFLKDNRNSVQVSLLIFAVTSLWEKPVPISNRNLFSFRRQKISQVRI